MRSRGDFSLGWVLKYPDRRDHPTLGDMLRVPLADGTLVATHDRPAADVIPSLLALSDVMGTGWFAADAANVKPGATVEVVGADSVLECVGTQQLARICSFGMFICTAARRPCATTCPI